MRAVLIIIFIALTVATYADAADTQPDLKPIPEGQIRLPVFPPGPQPEPPPQPKPDLQPVEPPSPQEVTELKADHWFVIESDIPFFVLDSRLGVVKIGYDEGPLKLKGKFADGSGRNETRTYTSKYIATVEAQAKGQVELLVIPAGATDAGVCLRRTLTVMGESPQPPPGPGPQPDDPPRPPGPVVGDANRVLIIYESSELSKYSPEQSMIFAAAKIREYLNRTCSKGPDGKTPEYRIWDKDVDTSNVSKVWQDAVKMPRASLPWIIVSNGTTGFSGPLPGTVDETIALLKKHLGE